MSSDWSNLGAFFSLFGAMIAFFKELEVNADLTPAKDSMIAGAVYVLGTRSTWSSRVYPTQLVLPEMIDCKVLDFFSKSFTSLLRG